jgi:DNA-binding IclR family transcriptional regulator
MGQSSHLKSPEFTFRIIEILGEKGHATCSELATECDRPYSTVNDYVRTLEDIGLIVEAETGFRLSTKFIQFSNMAQRSLPILDIAKNRVDELADSVSEYVSFSMEENNMCVIAYIVQGENAVNVGVSAGDRVPLTTAAPGKSILAHLPEQRVQRIIDREPDLRANSSPTPEEVRKELENIRQNGYASSDETYLEGIRAVAAPVVCQDNVLGAITIGGPSAILRDQRFKEDLPNLVLEASNKIEIEVTHNPAH